MFRWDYNNAYMPTPVYNLAALPYPTSASYPLMDDPSYQHRSPSRPVADYSVPSDFVADFLGKSGGNEQYPMNPPAYSPMISDAPALHHTGETPQFGPSVPVTVVPNIVRKSTTGIFKILECAMPSLFPVAINSSQLIAEIKADPSALNTQMWSGVLTNTPRDRYYRAHLSGMEKVLKTIVDDTLRRLRDDLNAPQLSVFLRRIWNTTFPVTGKKVEKFIQEYDSTNSKYFNGSTVVVSNEEEDQARLDHLDKQIAAAEAEVAAWHKLLAGGDTSLKNFRSMKANYLKELNRIDSNSVSLSVIRAHLATPDLTKSKIFLEGGSLGIPELPEWEHPTVREKKKLHEKFAKDMDEVFASSTRQSSVPKGCGIPAGSFCFDPASEIDDTWLTPPYEEWGAELGGDPPSITPLQSPLSVTSVESVPKKTTGSHRLSIDALRAFAQ